MKKHTLNHCKSRNTRQAKRTDTLEPKGTESGYNGYEYVIANGQTIPGLQMASKAFTFICEAELGKPYMLLEHPGRDLVRANDGIEGRGFGKKRMSICNGSNRGSKFALTRNGADLPDWCLIVCMEANL